MRDLVKFTAKVLLNYRFVFRSMFRLVYKIEHFIEIMLSLDHKLMLVDRHQVNQYVTFRMIYSTPECLTGPRKYQHSWHHIE